MPIQRITLFLAITQTFLNIIFIIPLNVKIILTSGGPMGYGLVLIPMTIPLFALSIFALVYPIKTLKIIEKIKISFFLNLLAFTLIFLFIFFIIFPTDPSDPSLQEAIKRIWGVS